MARKLRMELEKRFGVKSPENVPEILEVNTIENADKSENSFGIGVELILENKAKEEYQVNKDGIVFSWGDTAVIDDRSLNSQL